MIQILDPQTANGIAAGEVVERPASIVKELVENSFDAGATQIKVAITGGGMQSIVVTDNGTGIPAGELALAFERHATGKIRHLEDLTHIVSMGFRGEALPSIASVSRVRVQTREAGEEKGAEILLEASRILHEGPCSCPEGSQFEVRDLFFNVPARKKFLSKPYVEASYIYDLVQKLALTRPDVALSFWKDGAQLLYTPGDGNPLHAFYAIFGREYADHAHPVEFEDGSLFVGGFLCDPSLSWNNRSKQVISVNNRLVESRLIRQAIDEASKTWFMKRRYPVLLLYVHIPGDEIDCNVHPQKTELRFTDRNRVFQAVYRALHSTLLKSSTVYTPPLSDAPAQEVASVQETASDQETASAQDMAPAQAAAQLATPAPRAPEATTPEPTAPKPTIPDLTQISAVPASHEEALAASDAQTADLTAASEPLAEVSPEAVDEAMQVLAGASAQEPTPAPVSEPNPAQMLPPPSILAEPPAPYRSKEALQEERDQGFRIEDLLGADILGQVLQTYLVFASPMGLILVDQHAAHEKILYEKFVRQGALANAGTFRQPLLVPVEFAVGASSLAILEEQRAEVECWGFRFDRFSESSLILREVPADLPRNVDPMDIFGSILEEAENGNLGLPTKKEELLATMACKAAIKANKALRREDIKALVADLQTLENPYHCPHGRPIAIRFSARELEKLFKRIV